MVSMQSRGRTTMQRRGPALAQLCGMVVVLLSMSGCVGTSQSQITDLRRERSEPRILLMPLDVELSELNAGGTQEPNAEWTKAALQHIDTALRGELAARNSRLVGYTFDPNNADEVQLVKLNGAVGTTILMNQVGPGLALPSKRDQFDWSIGPEVQSLAQRTDADYGLLLYVRDSYTTAGRAAVFVLSAMFGVRAPLGEQVGFAMLVDLRSGNVVWFNRLLRRGGDLRTQELARETVQSLMTGFPK